MRLPISQTWAVSLAIYYVGAVVLTHFNKLAGAAAVLVGLGIFFRPLGRLLDISLLQSWRVLNRQARQEREAREEAPDHFDYRPLVVACTAAVCLTLIEYFGHRHIYQQAIQSWVPGFLKHRYFSLSTYAFWSGARVIGYIVIPWLVILCMPGERLRDYGMSFAGFVKHLWIYGLLFLIVLFPVTMVSFTKGFKKIYPFYKLAARSWTDLISWELLYGLQFFALEVFFRGFMIHPLRRSMGAYAIFAMAVPYCMIHYNKHLAEVLGAVVAGIVLGTLSLRTGSIWCGVLIHISVAWTMDGLSLFHTAGYPGNPRLVIR